MRQLRVLRVVGSVAVAALSWVLAERLTSGALKHRHVLAGGGAAVAHVHSSAILLAAGSVLMACLAGVLVVALATGAGRRASIPAAGPTAPPDVPQAGIGGGPARLAAAAATGVAIGALAVLDAAMHARSGQGLVRHPGVLAAVGVVQSGVVGLSQLLWQWCVDLVLTRSHRAAPVRVVLPVAGPVVVGADVARPKGTRPRAVRGRGPPRPLFRSDCLDLCVSPVPTLT